MLGLGAVGRHHARILDASARVDLLGAVEINGADGGIGKRRIYRSLDELLALATIDFAVVALPTSLHEGASVALADKGVHVLVEKPLAVCSREATAILEACRRGKVHGALGHVERYNPALVELKRLLLLGTIGAPVAIVSERSGPLPERARDMGVVSDLATHDLDLIPWLAGAAIETVFAQTSPPDAGGREHLAAITGRVGGGVVYNTVADWMSAVKKRRVRVVGEHGTLVADLLRPRLVHVDGEVADVPISSDEPLAVQTECFCDLLEGAMDAPVVSLEEGLRAVACADAALRSAREQRMITL